MESAIQSILLGSFAAISKMVSRLGSVTSYIGDGDASETQEIWNQRYQKPHSHFIEILQRCPELQECFEPKYGLPIVQIAVGINILQPAADFFFCCDRSSTSSTFHPQVEIEAILDIDVEVRKMASLFSLSRN